MSEPAAALKPVPFAGRFSLEATRPNAAEIAALAGILPRGAEVYLTAVPTQDIAELVKAAAALRKLGLEPVAHIAARRIAVIGDLVEMIAALRGEADMRKLLVVGGDVDKAGPFPDALAVIQKGGLREAGIEEVGIGGYPESHPRISYDRIEAALDAKLALAKARGLRVNIVSQFSFSPDRILTWLKRLRAGGVTVPVRIGMAGPASLTALLRYAKRCGVSASMRGLMSGAASGLLGHAGPDNLIDALSPHAESGALGDVSAHYFSFGGVLPTARYACEASGRTGARHAMARPN